MFKYLLFCLLLIPSTGFANIVPIAPAPDWVVTKQVELTAKIPKEEVNNGRYYLLVDKQTLVTKNSEIVRFRHFATKAINPEGVETESQINIEFDPSYQLLTLHNITIWRKGHAIDKTRSSKKTLLHQEKNLVRLIYNSNKTLNILLSDVRKGDIVDYSYTIQGNNPVFGGSFSLSHFLNWGVPLEHSFIRIIWQKSRKLHYKVYNSSLEIEESLASGGIEYIIQEKRIDALNVENSIPNWIEPYAYVRFSEVNTWEDVVNWGLPLFNKQMISNEAIKTEVKSIITNESSKAKQIALILNFVQTEVRYLGIEFGENSHRPSAASETLDRLYGDCKDKVVLFNTLLKEIGIKSYPALVNTETGNDLINQLPRYTAFDHVIAAVEYNNKTYWLDPTRLNQTKVLEDIHQPNFGYALLLKDANAKLTKIEPQQKQSGIIVNETFHVFNEPNLSADYKVSTKYFHHEAELMRGNQISKSNSDIRKGYIKFYQDYYPSLQEVSKATLTDNKKTNEYFVEENYLIETFWDQNKEKMELYGNFYANLISPFLTLPQDLKRTYPIKVPHPILRKQITKVYFEDDNWDFDKGQYNKSTPFFEYSESTKFSKKEQLLTLSYRYESKVDIVNPEDFNDYIKALKELKDHTSFGIFINMKNLNPESKSVDITNSPEINREQLVYWFLGAYSLLFVFTIILWRLDSSRNAYEEEMVFYPVSPIKFIVFWIATFGIYAMYWNYKNWKYVKKKGSVKLMPFARGFFYKFWYYPLYSALKEHNDTLSEKGKLPKPWLALTIAIAFATLTIIGSFLGYEIVVLIISSLLMLPLLVFINFINSENPKIIENNSKWQFRQILILILCVPIFIFTIGSEIGLLPSDAVVKGSSISSSELRFLQRKKIIEPSDEIIYFYSNDMFSNLNDGNGFTNNDVFSYWIEDNVFNFETADLKEIDNIEVAWSKNKLLDDTVVTILRKDKTSFLLFVSPVDKKDKLFVNRLKNIWVNATKDIDAK